MQALAGLVLELNSTLSSTAGRVAEDAAPLPGLVTIQDLFVAEAQPAVQTVSRYLQVPGTW